MPEMVANLLQGKARREEVACTGVAQAVRSARGQGEAEAAQMGVRDRRDARRRQRTNRGAERQEQRPMPAARSHYAQVTQDGLAHDGQQRIALSTTLLRSRNVDQFSFPIQIVQLQLRDLASPQSVHREQHQDGVVANTRGPIPPVATRRRCTSPQPGPSGIPSRA